MLVTKPFLSHLLSLCGQKYNGSQWELKRLSSFMFHIRSIINDWINMKHTPISSSLNLSYWYWKLPQHKSHPYNPRITEIWNKQRSIAEFRKRTNETSLVLGSNRWHNLDYIITLQNVVLIIISCTVIISANNQISYFLYIICTITVKYS